MSTTIVSVTGQVLGGTSKTFDGVSTVKELAEKMNIGDNYAVKINGIEAKNGYDTALQSYEFVTFGEKVKGGRK